LSILASSATYVYVLLRVISGHGTLGDLILYTAAATALQSAIQTIFSSFSDLYEHNLYLGTLATVLAVPETVTAPERPAAMRRPVRGHIVFDNVLFSYPGATGLALDDMSFEIPPHSTIALVGANGAGK